MAKAFQWNPEKNSQLLRDRKITFETVVAAIEGGQLIDIVAHPNLVRYPNQRMFIVKMDNYVYLVPFVEDEASIFLKTIIPSRKMTKQYLRGASKNES